MLLRSSSACLIAVLLVGSAGAQRYHTQTYTEADGLQSSTVHAVTQTPDGCMWFATRAGTARYDGSTWTSYGVKDGLAAPAQGFLRVDERGTLWTVGVITGIQVAWHEDGKWHPLPHYPASPPRQEVTAFELLSRNGRDYQLVGSSHGQLHVWDGDDWTTLNVKEAGSRSEVTAVVPWGQVLLIASGERTLALPLDELERLDAATGALRPAVELVDELPDEPIQGFCLARDDEQLWLVGEDWIGVLDEHGFERLADGLELELQRAPRTVVPDNLGGLYFGSRLRLCYYHPEHGLEVLERPNGLIDLGATCVFVDREDNTWITGVRGVTKLISRRFASLSSEHGLFADEVSAVLERRSGEMVLGHPGGLTFLSEPMRTLPLSDALTEGRVLDVAESDDGHLWVAANALGLAEIDENDDVHWHSLEPETTGPVSAVHVDEAGELWVGSSYKLFRRVVSNSGALEFEVVELPGSKRGMAQVRRIVGGRDGAIYVGTFAGEVYRVRGGQFDRWEIPEQNVHTGIFALLEASDGAVWVGSGAGLWVIREEQLDRVEPQGPTISRPVYQIVEESERGLWFGTDNGVFIWDGEGLEHLTARHGLIGSEANRAAGVLDSRGHVWVGLDHGVSVYRPEHEQARSHFPTVELLTADASGTIYALDEELSLGHDDNTLIFAFRAIAFVDEERIGFRVWLEGFDEGEASARSSAHREVRYTNLPPGEYRLHVRAIDAEGRESVEAVSRRIVIGRPLWRSPWFGALAFALLAVGVYGAIKHMAQRDYARRLEQEVRGRTSQLRASEEAMAAEKERLAVTLASIADGVAATDHEGRIVLWNDAAARLMGLPAERARGRHLSQVLQLSVAPVVGEGRVIEESVLIGSEHGVTRQLVVSGAPIAGRDGTPWGSVLAFRDVTDKNRVERELAKTQRLEALGVLAGGIAHDFNNLLTIVLGGLSLLEADGRLGMRGYGIVRDIEGATIRARSLTEQLMTFSRGGAPVRRAASIADVIRETASFALRGASVRADIELPDNLWVVEIDEGQMSQVLHNLLINARQAMPEGGTVRIRGANLEPGPGFLEPGRYVEIQVSDDGPGIAPGHLDRLFDPYFSTKDEGSGLGLATAHSIVEKHEGRLTVDPESDTGATFRIYLPASASVLSPRQRRELPRRSGSGRILVMDDDQLVRSTIRNMVESLGYRTRGAADGTEALALYADARASGVPFDLVLMDLTVPGGMGGKEAIRHLIELDPDAIAIVASGYSTDPVLSEPEAYGFRGRLDKPFVLEDLARALEEALLQGARPQGTETL